ncbi:hypothetical protein ACFZBU_33475 [Embleya sp. NPDC008237]|uniref:hypothetical protein n=1 Tax=Embleya sp. NPDC008237 TaxID=3363978 RepID=UPI0036E8E94A
MFLRDHPIFREFRTLGFPSEDCVVAGSGPLLAHGIRSDISDLDIVVNASLWESVKQLGQPTASPFGFVRHILLFDGRIEILNGWFAYDVNSLIAEAEFFEGVGFLPLERTLEWKSRLNRAKDRRDVELIAEYLEHGTPGVSETRPVL